ncbi:MAG: alpha/beta hydrolase [Pseudomonadota bacterium]
MHWRDRIFNLDAWLEANFPPAGDLISVDDQTIHAIAAGPEGETECGVPLILLHGASGNALDWQVSVLPELARRYRVVALDRPGFGHSSPPPRDDTSLAGQVRILRAALHKMGHRRYILVGHSYSGALILRWALDFPEEVAGLVPISGATCDWGGGLGPGNHLKGAPVIGRAIAALARVLATRSYLKGALAEIFAPQPVPPEYLATAGVEFVLRPGTFSLNAAMMRDLGGLVTAQTPDYSRIMCPVTAIHGTADIIVPIDLHADVLARTLPDAHIVSLDGIGHMPHHVASGDVIAAIDALTDRVNRKRQPEDAATGS